MPNKTIYVSNIQKFSVHDGPGIRTVVFILGCPLRCKWCQNPETWSGKPDLMINDSLCTKCGECVKVCPTGAIYIGGNGKVMTDRTKCTKCWACVDACLFDARQISAKPYTVDEVFAEIKKDEVFYKNSGGGVTMSGGEPMTQPDFCLELFSKCKASRIHTAVETCGYTVWENFEKIMKVTDLFLFDLKLFDSEKHKKWTGVDNARILDNLTKLSQAGKSIIIRVPLIPGVNDDEEEFRNMMKFSRTLNMVQAVHILPFHQLGASKYDMVEIEYQLKKWHEENKKSVDRCRKIALEMGFRVSIGGAGFKEDYAAFHKVDEKKKESFLYNV